MWNVLEKAAEHVALYSTICGKAWYLCVFVFRLIVVASIGGSVYNDEQSAFRCSTKVLGCDNVCYDRFAKISHIRFWAFQLVALCSPVVIFHFYTVFVQSDIEISNFRRRKESELEATERAKINWNILRDHIKNSSGSRKLTTHHHHRAPKVVKTRAVYEKSAVREIQLTKGVQIAYIVSVALRMILEFIFLYLAYELFRFASYQDVATSGAVVSDGRQISKFSDLFWLEVPQLYRCSGPDVQWACGEHMLPGSQGAYVPCWVSRPWEKTIFLRYMNTLSVLCFFLSFGELVQLIGQAAWKYYKKWQNRKPYEIRSESTASAASLKKNLTGRRNSKNSLFSVQKLSKGRDLRKRLSVVNEEAEPKPKAVFPSLTKLQSTPSLHKNESYWNFETQLNAEGQVQSSLVKEEEGNDMV